jgi:hypothetical protein
MIMSREDVFMVMMEEEISIVRLRVRSSTLRLPIHLITQTVLLRVGDKFLLSSTLEKIALGIIQKKN